jgi:hypothetical protein
MPAAWVPGLRADIGQRSARDDDKRGVIPAGAVTRPRDRVESREPEKRRCGSGLESRTF